MISKYLDAVVTAILLMVIVVAPTQYSFSLAGAHLSIADPLVWIGGFLFFVSAALRSFSSGQGGLAARAHGFLKEILPLPENLLFIILIALSMFKAQSRIESAKELFQALEYVLVAFVLFSRSRYDEKMLGRIVVVLFGVASVVVTVALFQYFGKGIDIMGVKGTFGNRNTYGGFLAVILPLLLSAVLLSGNWMLRAWGAAILIASGITLLSGAAALGLLAGCSLVCALVSRRAFYVWLIIIVVGGTFALTRLPRNNVEVLVQSIRIFDDEGKVEPRYTEWQASLQMWREDPLLGVGIGNYQSQIGTNYGFLQIKEGPKEQDHNNLFLVFGSSTGVIGLAGLMAMLILWLQRMFVSWFSCRSIVSGDSRILALGAAGAIVAFCITSIWTAMLVRGVFLLFVIIVSLAVSRLESRIGRP